MEATNPCPATVRSTNERLDAYWVAAIALAVKEIVKYGKTKREAQRRLSELLVASARQTLSAPSRLSVQEWVDQWLSGFG